MSENEAAGSIVIVAVLVVENATFCAVVPDTDTEYGVSAETFDPLKVNEIRRVDPITVVTAVAVAVIAGPEVSGWRLTVTWAGEMVPLGKLLPTTVMAVIPGCPAAGDVLALSVTCARKGAVKAAEAINAITAQ